MKKLSAVLAAAALACCLAACARAEAPESQPQEQVESQPQPQAQSEAQPQAEARTIQVSANGATVVFELNDSAAASALLDQLPLTVEVEDFGTNEKICYPPHPLDVSDAPHAQGGAGTLAYYEPWGDVVLFYGAYAPNDDLYEVGQATSGADGIEALAGTITIAAAA